MNTYSASRRNSRLTLTCARHVCSSIRRSPILFGSALGLMLAPNVSVGEILSTYTFGPDGTSPGILTPSLFHPNVTAGTIVPGSGVTLDLSNSQTPVPASSPWLRVQLNQTTTTQAAAVTNNAYFEFSLTANAGFLLDLASMTFDGMRGGASTPRGYVVRSSVDSFATTLSAGDFNTQRPTFTNINVDLTGPAFQDLGSITFRIYSYSPATGSTIEYDNFIVNGALQSTGFTGITWTAAVNGLWNTTTPNWSGPGGMYVDATPTSNVIFDDSGAIKNVTVDAPTLHPNAVKFDNTAAYTLSGGQLIIADTLIKEGTGTTTLSTPVTAAGVTLNAGTIVVGVSGALSATNGTISSVGSLVVESGGVLVENTALQVNGNLTLNAATQTLAALAGGSTGVVTLNGTALNVTNSSAFSGRVTGTGSIVKNSPGTFTLGGPNDYTGGTMVNGGNLLLGHASAASAGPVFVNAGGAVTFAAGVTAPIVVNGGTLGAAGNAAVPGTVLIQSDSTVVTYNPASGTGSSDLILTGLLQGTEDINLLSINGINPDSQAFRLRGPASDYSGTITVNQSAKFELQTSGASGSPMGTGTLVLTGGGTTTTQQGTYSLVNVRNLSGGDTTFGNNVRIVGTGTAFFNLLGTAPAGSTMNFGDLLIGDGQAVGAGATDSAAFTVAFSTVHLTGGIATFTPQPVGNTGFDTVQNIRLGTITENAPGSGIMMDGAATLTLAGVNTYTGPTTLQSGVTVLAAGASIAGSNAVIINSGATLDASAIGLLNVPATQSMTVNGTLNAVVGLAGTLRGSGVVSGSVVALSGALVSPGNSPGALTVQNLTLDLGAVLQAEVSKVTAGFPPVAGFDYDSVIATNVFGGVSPTVTLGGTLSLMVGTGIEQNDVFTIILNASTDAVVGTFEGMPNGALFTVGGQAFQISYADDSNTPAFELAGGNDVSLLAVPEPGAVGLLLGGLAACLQGRRRRGSSA